MIRVITSNIVRFFLILLIQVLIMDNIRLGGLFNPYFYTLFILLLPFETPGWLLLLSAFLLGTSMDVVNNTPGMHTMASLLMAFVRPYLLNLSAPREGYDTETYPRIYFMGFSWFLKYTLVLVFIHHLLLFYLEAFTFTNFFFTFLRVILSTALTTSTILLSQFFIFRK
ncbi:MAG: rod shape-determining protein MreD [Bacteroidota bacterium]